MFRPVSNCLSAAKCVLPAVFSRPASYEISPLYKALQSRDYRDIGSFGTVLKAELLSKKSSWDEEITPLHLIASHISLYRTKIFREVAGDVDPKIIPPHYENPIEPILRRYARIQDENGNIPLHLAVLNKNWELARFLAERFGTSLIKNNDGYTPAWLIAKTIPFQLDRSVSKDSDPCYQTGRFMMGSNTLFRHMGIDENEWNMLHWMAFKGYSEPYYEIDFDGVSCGWREKDKQGLTPEKIHSLLESIANDGVNKNPEEISNIFSKLPKERKEELGKAIRERITNYATKAQNLSNILQD